MTKTAGRTTKSARRPKSAATKRLASVKVAPQAPAEKAHSTGRWAETMFKALTKRIGGRWRFVSFRGAGGGEWRGVVDILAVRKNSSTGATAGIKAGDLFDFVLVQLKGGDARDPTQADVVRLRQVARHYRARRVVLFAWKLRTHAEYSVLQRDGSWAKTSAADAFA